MEIRSYEKYLVLQDNSTDPTYKEWKWSPDLTAAATKTEGHGSYLQGMEIAPNDLCKRLFSGHGSYLQGMEMPYRGIFFYHPSVRHGSYLQGMEIDKAFVEKELHRSTDPTYKEWK